MVDQFSQHHLLKRLSLLHCIFLPPLSKIGVHRCMDLSLGFPFCSIDHTVLMTLWYSLKSGRLIPPILVFFLKIALAIQVFCVCEIICYSSVKNTIGSLIGIVLNL